MLKINKKKLQRTTYKNALVTGTYTIGSCELPANCARVDSSEEIESTTMRSTCCTADLCNAFNVNGVVNNDILVRIGNVVTKNKVHDEHHKDNNDYYYYNNAAQNKYNVFILPLISLIGAFLY